MKKAKTIWVMVADEAIARILEWPTRGHELVPVEELTDPSAHAKGTEVNTDAVGHHHPDRLRLLHVNPLTAAIDSGGKRDAPARMPWARDVPA